MEAQSTSVNQDNRSRPLFDLLVIVCREKWRKREEYRKGQELWFKFLDKHMESMVELAKDSEMKFSIMVDAVHDYHLMRDYIELETPFVGYFRDYEHFSMFTVAWPPTCMKKPCEGNCHLNL
jgi:hypothetical protein